MRKHICQSEQTVTGPPTTHKYLFTDLHSSVVLVTPFTFSFSFSFSKGIDLLLVLVLDINLLLALVLGLVRILIYV